MMKKIDVTTLKNRLYEELAAAQLYEEIPNSSILELLYEPVESKDVFDVPLFLDAALRLESRLTAGGPSRQWGSAVSPGIAFPPITNRGVTKLLDKASRKKIMGGYDGGLEVGFNGQWNETALEKVIESCEKARQASSDGSEDDDRYVNLDGNWFMVKPHGGGDKVHYRYILEGLGLKIYIHNKPKASIQPIRIRYGYESVVGRNPFKVHELVVNWLHDLGFVIEKETISRADAQVMVERPMEEFVSLFSRHLVRSSRKHSFVGDHSELISTATFGQSIQICLYNKKKELLTSGDEAKLMLMLNECLGGVMPEHLTRIEFRFNRKALKSFGINTMKDLQECENALMQLIANEYFRFTAEPKNKGNEWKQEVHPIWKEVQDLLNEYFPSDDVDKKSVERKTRRQINCTADALVKQAMGCFSTAIALTKGFINEPRKALDYIMDKVRDSLDDLLARSQERTKELGIVRDIESPDSEHWELDPDFALDERTTNTVHQQYWGLSRVPA